MEDELLNYQEAMDWTDSMESEYKNGFKAGFEAGKQERDREIIEKLGELITFMEGEVKRWENHADKDVQSRNTGYLGGLKKAMRLIENLSK